MMARAHRLKGRGVQPPVVAAHGASVGDRNHQGCGLTGWGDEESS